MENKPHTPLARWRLFATKCSRARAFGDYLRIRITPHQRTQARGGKWLILFRDPVRKRAMWRALMATYFFMILPT